MMTAEGPTRTAGLVSVLPSTLTRPAAIQASASRREQRPARAMRLAIRSPRGSATFASAPFGSAFSVFAAPSARGVDEGIENFLIAGADGIFRMPLHTDAVAVARILDALDHTIGCHRIDDDARANGFHRLVMRAVDR